MSDASENRNSSAGDEFPAEEPAVGDAADGGAAQAADDDLSESEPMTADPTEAASEGETLEQMIEGDLGRVAAERDEYLDSLRRLQADFDNYRKRAMRQQTELLERASENLLVQLLPVIDALDLAEAHAGEGSDNEALTQIGTLLRGTLQREGLERIDAVGVPFDPTVHDAVAHEPADEDGDEKGSVSEVMRAGYRLKGRVVRPAMVKVKG